MNIYSYIYELPPNLDGAPALENEPAARLADLFGALSDPSRLRILSVLIQGEAHVQQICEQVGMSHSAVSHQLRGLRQMRIVRARKQGRQVFYSLDDDHVSILYRIGLDHVLHS
jgi:DNA-binding transcriptional ArsR family regulator